MLGLRLSFGLMTLLALLIAIGSYAIWLLLQMNSAIQGNFTDTYSNLRAIQAMRLATTRINMTYFGGDWPSAIQMDHSFYTDNVETIDKGLQTLKSNIQDAEASELVKRFEYAVRDYQGICVRIFLLKPEHGKEYLELRRQIGPSTLLMTELSEQLLKLNERELLKTQRGAETRNVDSIWFMVIAIMVAVGVSFYTAYRLHSVIVRPIRTLTHYVQRVGDAGEVQLLEVKSRDELGRLAAAFNEMVVRVHNTYQAAVKRISQLDVTMQTTLATFPDPIYVIDQSGKIVLRNPAGKSFSQESGIGDALPLEIHDRALEAIRTCQDYTPTSFKDTYSYRIGEQKKYFLPRILVMRKADKSIHGVAVVLQDVTRFQLIDDLKTNLVSTVSHELKTPLTSIRMALHILMEQKVGGLNREQWAMVAAAQEDSERLLRTLNNLLDISRMEDGFGALKLELVDPGELAVAAVHDVRRRATARHISLQVEAEPDLPRVQVDRLRIAHVFRNFLTNAIKYSPEGSSIVFYVRRRVRDPQTIRFSVIDQGPGVPPEYQASVFQKFFRIPNQTKAGAGLGLSIARQVAEAHQGRVGVISKDGEGSEFFCDLPVAGIATAAEPAGALAQTA